MRCTTCGKSTSNRITRCQACGESVQRPRRAPAAEADDGWSLTPQQSPAAASYRYGLLGLIPVAGLILGPLALVRGLQGLRQANVKARENAQALAGVILGTLELLSNCAGLGLLWVTLTASS